MINKEFRTCRCIRRTTTNICYENLQLGRVYDYRIVIYDVRKRVVKYQVVIEYCFLDSKKIPSDSIYLSYKNFKNHFVDVVTNRNKTITNILNIDTDV